ncbi:two-component system sensor histidine kinase DesK [Pseudonocardia hierapolitana]|uniref:Two-component system sensor histidine kinase DesK n=1 Tax=Pseudonocardia hierapolitana TaxID=1128676 RepID=A0A561SHD6_9PSEU|nr:two-component system sensor histidine kinase DesK [Pseudonocardia hierapolitana]
MIRDVPTDTPRDPRLGRARVAVLGSLVVSVASTVIWPGIGALRFEARPLWQVLGSAGILAVAITQAAALYAAATPGLAERTRRRYVVAFLVAVLASVPLVAPVATEGPEGWDTWAWLGAAVVGSVPLLMGTGPAVGVAVLATALSAATGAATGGSAATFAVITAGVGLSLLAIHGLPVVLWHLVLEARDGREAQARLAITEERLRFARDVHDLLGHHLSVIALKAELAQRLAVTDPERAGREAGEVRELAAGALAEMREVVHGYRAVDLAAQLDAVARVLGSSGVRCTVVGSPGPLPETIATGLAATVREAGTNVLRHSRAKWCRIDLVRTVDDVRLTVANDGAGDARPDTYSSGLQGLSDRLARSGGRLRTTVVDGVFTLDALLPVPRP